jgi:hypothetical protein
MRISQYENIALHYFTVKILALYAGLSEAEAQNLAEITQFTGDYAASDVIECERVCEVLIDRGIAVYDEEKDIYTVTVNPTSVSQNNWFDEEILLNRDNQKKIFVPFHFFPPEKLENNQVYTVDSSSKLFNEICFARPGGYVDPFRDEFLVRMGVFLHTRIDMFTHELLCGFETDKSTRLIKLGEVLRDMPPPQENITQSYKKDGWEPPNIGFAPLGRALDDGGVWLDFGIGESHHTVVTKSRNVKTAKEIYRFIEKLCGMRGDDPPEYPEGIKGQLTSVYGCDDDFDTIKQKWTAVFCGPKNPIQFSTDFFYNADDVSKRLLGGGIKRLRELPDFNPLTQFLLAASDIIMGVYK